MKPQNLLQIFILITLLLSGCAPAGELTREPTSTPRIVPESKATPTPAALTQMAPETIILSWQREGGIAGFCDKVVVRLDGGFTSGTCAQPALYSAKLSAENLALVTGWVARFQSFRHSDRDPAVADAMTIKIDFVGAGTAQAGEAERVAMSTLASQLIPSLALTPVSDGGYPAVVFKAREALATKISLSAEKIEIVSVQPVDWPDACLGVSNPEVLCAMVITPGYRLILRANGSDYEVHTDTTTTIVMASLRPAINP